MRIHWNKHIKAKQNIVERGKSPHGVVRVELGSFGFLPDPFQSLTLLKNPLLGFVYKVNLNARTHTLSHVCRYTHAYTQCMCMFMCMDLHIRVDFDPLHLLQPSGSILLFISITNSNKDLIFSLLIWLLILLSSVSIGAFQKETKACCPDDLPGWRSAIKQTVGLEERNNG